MSHLPCNDATDSLDFTITQEGNLTTVTFNSGAKQGQVCRVDIPELRRRRREKHQQSSQQNDGPAPEDTTDVSLTTTSYHAFEVQISKEEYEALEALENYHSAYVTLHVLYPEEFSSGYTLQPSGSETNGDDASGDARSHIRHEPELRQ